MILETKRLFLREMTENDFDALYMNHYMNHTNEPSAKTALSYGCELVEEFAVIFA